MSKVTVACSFPNGLLLRVFEMVDAIEASPTGPRSFKRAQQVGPTIEVAGPRHFRGIDLQTPPRPLPRMQGRFAITENVDASFWETWLSQNHDLELVKAGMIFAFPSGKPDHIAGKAKDHKDEKTGFEPLDMVTKDAQGRIADPRVPRRLGHVTGIETADDASANKPMPAA